MHLAGLSWLQGWALKVLVTGLFTAGHGGFLLTEDEILDSVALRNLLGDNE
jgi:hypothetical protein